MNYRDIYYYRNSFLRSSEPIENNALDRDKLVLQVKLTRRQKPQDKVTKTKTGNS